MSPTPELFDPAAPSQIKAIEEALKCPLPDDLRSLLEETDGVSGEYGLRLVWNSQEIASSNLEFRSMPAFRELYMPFDHLLFFGDSGGGDQFAYAILAGRVRKLDIFAWDHEDDSREWVAGSLLQYLEWSVARKIQR